MTYHFENKWCSTCLQAVDTATPTGEPGSFYFEPCGHEARFYEASDDVASGESWPY